MKTTVSIVIATCGDDRWRVLAEARPLPSTEGQGAHEVIVHHEPGGTVASARNNAAAGASGDWIVFLDADDELRSGYVSAMRAMMRSKRMITPAVEYRRNRRAGEPRVWPEVDLRDGNWLTIGTAVPKETWAKVGGFAEGIDLYEDWHFWARCGRTGIPAVACHDAVYVAHVRNDSRNRRQHQRTRLYWHQWIGHDVFPESYAATTASEDARKQLETPQLRRL